MPTNEATPIRHGTPAARWVLAATVLGSGVAFLDGTVVNVALPAIGRDLGAGRTGLQWILDSYLVTLTALVLLGGSLGDRFGRRRLFVAGLAGFAGASALCGLAPSTGTLVAARAVQGVAAALLVPGSLALISSSFHPDDRARAVGAWSGRAGVASAAGPLAGGWLVDAASWRWIFLLNLPLVGAAIWITLRHVPESHGPGTEPVDGPGAVLATAGLALVAYALIEGPARWDEGGFSFDFTGAAGLAGLCALAGFVVRERRARHPMLPLGLFRSPQFTGANLTTLAVYGALGGALFLVVVRLQSVLGYSALEAGASLLPMTLIMLAFSARAGALAERTGPRLPMTIGPLVAAAGLLLFSRLEPGRGYTEAVLPAVVVFGLGLALTVAPLTAAVLAAAPDHLVGVASGVNNAVARLAALLAVALLPSLPTGFAGALRLSALVAAAGGAAALLLVGRGRAPAPPPCGQVLAVPGIVDSSTSVPRDT